jgi:hypothetical protein
MLGKTISHYPALRDSVLRDKIIDGLGQGGMPSFSEKYNKLVPHGGRRRI